MVQLKLRRVDNLVKAEASLQPREQGKDLVGRTHLETARAAIGTVGVEVHRGGSNAAAFFGVVEDLILRHGQNSAGLHFDTDRGASQFEGVDVVGHEFPDLVLGNLL